MLLLGALMGMEKLRKSVGQTGVGVALIALRLVVTLRVDFHP